MGCQSYNSCYELYFQVLVWITNSHVTTDNAYCLGTCAIEEKIVLMAVMKMTVSDLVGTRKKDVQIT